MRARRCVCEWHEVDSEGMRVRQQEMAGERARERGHRWDCVGGQHVGDSTRGIGRLWQGQGLLGQARASGSGNGQVQE